MRKADRFANNLEAALQRRAAPAIWPLLGSICAGLILLLIWAYLAVLEEVTRADGKVIPAGQLQVVQPLEAGIVTEIRVREGDRVTAGALLVRLDETGAAASLGELTQKRSALLARYARLTAEAEGREPIFGLQGMLEPVIVGAETALLNARREALATELATASQQLAQRLLERKEIDTRIAEGQTTRAIAQRGLDLAQNLAKRGAFPEMDLLKIEQSARAELRDLAILEATKPRAEAAIAEAQSRINAIRFGFEARAREQLAETAGQIAVIEETIRAAEDRVRRAQLKAPVTGIVNKLAITTIGAVAKPGESIVEIVPLEGTLLVEARVRPQDVAFLSPGLAARVKVTAYDYTVYGDLSGQVERISADTLPGEKGETFYRVIVRTDRAYLGPEERPLPIIPGMVVNVDILTGKKTVLDYFLRPFKKIGAEALRER